MTTAMLEKIHYILLINCFSFLFAEVSNRIACVNVKYCSVFYNGAALLKGMTRNSWQYLEYLSVLWVAPWRPSWLMYSGYECLRMLFPLPHVLCVTAPFSEGGIGVYIVKKICFCSSAAVCRVGVGFSREPQQEHS